MRENAWKKYDEAGLKEVFEYCEGYKKYISDCKTERECVSESIRIRKPTDIAIWRMSSKTKKR